MSTNPPLLCIPPDKVRAIWPRILPMVEAAYLAVDEFAPPDLLDWLVAGKGLLWIAVLDGSVVAALTTSLVKKPSGLACRMVSCGGSDMDRWLDRESQIVEYARGEGCVKVTAEGRLGWSRILPGYEATRVFLEKVL